MNRYEMDYILYLDAHNFLAIGLMVEQYNANQWLATISWNAHTHIFQSTREFILNRLDIINFSHVVEQMIWKSEKKIAKKIVADGKFFHQNKKNLIQKCSLLIL